ncbi:MAG: hypothetical protein IPK64_13145 [bacterium]|nr:hypothetical protein [bacterium]
MAAAAALAAAGSRVWAVKRRGGAAPEGVRVVAADLAAGPPAGLPERLDAIVLAVAPGGSADSYASTYPPAARAAVALARATAARSIVYTSSTGVYGGKNGEWVDEKSPRSGAGPGQAALCEAEDLLLESGLTGVTVLRIAGIYGPGREICPRYANSEKLPLRGSCWVNLAHRDDIVAAMVLALQYSGSPRVLNVCDGAPAQASEVARWCAGVRGEAPDAQKFNCDDPPTRSNQRISNAALRDLGWRPRFASFRERGDGL